jgi:RNA polymerase sigma factor (sigma-70 family)
MNYEDMVGRLAEKAFLDKLYGFAYRRCASSCEAEDLCSEIIVAVLASLRRNPQVHNFHAFVWTVARRVYADFCDKRRRDAETCIATDFSQELLSVTVNPTDDYIESETERVKLRGILREISFLSKIYRDVMVLYYLDGFKTSQIAEKLGITETAVKQRLFSARNTIKKEAEKMETNHALQPVEINFIGSGTPVGNDPRTKAERVLSKNLVYLCKNTALSAGDFAEKLGVPMLFIEDEINIQLKGQNGTYGLLRKLESGKYISNVIILDQEALSAGSNAFSAHLQEFCEGIKAEIHTNREKILSFPFLSRQEDPRFVFWTLIKNQIPKLNYAVECNIKKAAAFTSLTAPGYPFSVLGIAMQQGDMPVQEWYGIDGIQAESVGSNRIFGYKTVQASNVYGKRLAAHFHCGHSITADPLLMLTIRAIGGLQVSELTEIEKEYAAKALECGYLRKDGALLVPKIVVISEETKQAFYRLLDPQPIINSVAQKIAQELIVQINKHVPKHLLNEFPMYILASTWGLEGKVIEYCIENDILTAPENRLCAEGVLMVAEK